MIKQSKKMNFDKMVSEINLLLIKFNQQVKDLHSVDRLELLHKNFFLNDGEFMREFKKIKSLKVNFKSVDKSYLIDFNKQKSDAIKKVNDIKCISETEYARKLESLKFECLKDFVRKKSIHGNYINGGIHPVTKEIFNIKNIFEKMGFSLEDAPDIETDQVNFSDLNIPEQHPSRSMHDTFYIESPVNKSFLLRTHTSNAQIHFLKKNGHKEARVLSIGRVYRSDHDSTHTPMFHQVEGFCIGSDINLSNLKYCINEFLREFFKCSNLRTRFRPSYFPFTEPSFEVDIAYDIVDEKLVLNGDKWLEVLGAGMINKKVFQNCNIKEKVRGFAFGLGLTRLVMLKYNIKSLSFYGELDNRWIKNFNSPVDSSDKLVNQGILV